MKPTLLIVDDEKTTREGLRAALEERYDVYIAEDAKAAMNLLESENFDVMLTDFRLPNEDGMKLIARAKSLPKPPICILMTAYGSEELAVDAMKRGADDYIAKGRLQIDELEMRIARALKQQNLEVENVSLRKQLDSKFGLENIIGQSPAMKEIFEIVQQVAPTRATVLVLRRKRHGQGTDREGAAPVESARAAAVRDGALRGARADAAGKRIVRPRTRRVHRRARAAHRPVRAGAGRHAVSRRNRRD